MQCRPEDDVMLVFILGLTQAHSHDLSEGFLLALMQATSSTFSETALKNSWSTVYGNVRQTMQIRLRCLCSGLVQVVCKWCVVFSTEDSTPGRGTRWQRAHLRLRRLLSLMALHGATSRQDRRAFH